MRRGVCIALATAMLLLVAPTLALGVAGFVPVRTQPPLISPDLVAQQDTICVPAMVKSTQHYNWRSTRRACTTTTSTRS